MLSIAAFILFVLALMQFPGGVGVDPECLGYGALISLLVSMVKGIPFIKKNPKTVSAILSLLWVTIPAVVRGGADFKVIAFCVLTQFSTSVAFYEAGTRQFKKLQGKDGRVDLDDDTAARNSPPRKR